VQVVLDRARADEQAAADLGVGELVVNKLDDMCLTARERLARVHVRRADDLAGCAQLPAARAANAMTPMVVSIS